MMRMLVVGTSPTAIEPAVNQLENAGHTVVRCHESGAGPFPCLALSEDRTCPLDEGPVDVAVTIRNRAWPRPSGFEDGAICALRRRIPLLVAGVTESQPFEPWSTHTLTGDTDLVAACEAAAAAPLPEHADVTRQAARRVLAVAGRATGVGARVSRHQGRLQAEVSIPLGCSDLTTTLAARVTAALRHFDPHATVIDVSVTEAPSTPPSNQPSTRQAARP